jgi:hypothetical protein
MTLKLYRPDPDGGLAPAPVQTEDYRRQLRSRRWQAAKLSNPEVKQTDPRIAVLFVALLAFLTFGVLIVGYGIGIWN